MQTSPILDVRGVSKVYRRGRVEVAALRDVSFRLTSGGNLDTATGEDILALLTQAVANSGLSIVMVTHSLAAARAAKQVLSIRDGMLASSQASLDDQQGGEVR